jgi:glyoxylate carboligase
LFSSILLFNIPKNLSDIFFKHIIINKYTLGYIPSCSNNFSFNYFIDHEFINISLDLVEGYIIEVADNIYYFG